MDTRIIELRRGRRTRELESQFCVYFRALVVALRHSFLSMRGCQGIGALMGDAVGWLRTTGIRSRYIHEWRSRLTFIACSTGGHAVSQIVNLTCKKEGFTPSEIRCVH